LVVCDLSQPFLGSRFKDHGDRRGPRRGSRVGVLMSPNTKAATGRRTPKQSVDFA